MTIEMINAKYGLTMDDKERILNSEITIFDNIEFQEDYYFEYDEIVHFTNWPVIYIIYNKTKSIAYVGETVDLKTRLMQHFQDPSKESLKAKNTKVMFINYSFANKSTCQEIENFLILNMGNDDRFDLLNGNGGLQKYDYYDKEKVMEICKMIWEKLHTIGMANNNYKVLQQEKFQYSPYLSLNQEQNYNVKKIINELIIHDKQTIIVNGDVGTGKTAVAIHLLKLLMDYSNNFNGIILEDMVNENINNIKMIMDYFINRDIKIGIVFPMGTLYSILRRSIKQIYKGNVDNFVFQPLDALKNYLDNKRKFNILIVDEAHSLISDTSLYSKKNQALLKKSGFYHKNQLEWFMEISNKQIFFYDSKQNIRKHNVEQSFFTSLKNKPTTETLFLTTQERCIKGGEEYINCLSTLFNKNTIFTEKKINELKEQIRKINKQSGYKFVMYENVTTMTNEIKRLFDMDKTKNKGMCYTLTGNCWPKKNKERDIINKKYGKVDDTNYSDYVQTIIENDAHNIDIGTYKNILNSVDNWVNRDTRCRNEVGVIHAIAGLNAEYVGVIIGNDLSYDAENNTVKGETTIYNDKGKNNATEEEKQDFILRSYYILCSRARKGTFIYICNDELRSLFEKFMIIEK